MLAIHFGAGNIGRGFIGCLLSQSGYQVCFVDVNTEIVNLINQKNEYRVILADETRKETVIQNIYAINSMTHPEKVIEAIAKADIITTAVGPHILEKISDLIKEGLRERAKLNKSINIIACENMIGGSQFLKEKVYEGIPKDEQKKFDELFGFPNAAVDRIVPIQENEDKLLVAVEPFYEWVVDNTQMKGTLSVIEGITLVHDLTPFIERKLFTVNTGHAVAAYVGYQAGHKTIKDAMDDETVFQAVQNTLAETGNVLIKKYHFDLNEHRNYIQKIIKRFQNPFINDEVTRVARGPIRKLGRNDRLISPAIQHYDLLGREPEYLAKAIVSAVKYDFQLDEEAQKLQEKILQLGYEKALQEISGLEKGHPLLKLVHQYI